jgi:hypothetical protein
MLRFSQLFSLCFWLFFSLNGFAQELFPNAEAATNVPKGIPGLRITATTFKEYNLPRNMVSARIMYGITARWTIWAEGTLSNHHDSILPQNLVTHSHPAGGTFYYTNNKQYGKTYPYLFKGMHLFSKYRILSFDGPQKHLRVSLYSEYIMTMRKTITTSTWKLLEKPILPPG